MSSFRSPVIVLLMIHLRHSPTPTGLMPLSIFLSGTSLHARRVDMYLCGMVFVARRLARVAISSASFCELVPYDFEQIISLHVSMSICVDPPNPDEFLALGCDFILSYVFKDNPHCFGFRLINFADCFSSAAAFGCFSFNFFLVSVVMSCFPLMSLALSTNLRAFFICACSISL